MNLQKYYDAKEVHEKLVDYAVKYEIEDTKVIFALEILYAFLSKEQDEGYKTIEKYIRKK